MTRALEVRVGDSYNSLTVIRATRLPNTPGQIRKGCTTGVRASVCLCDCGKTVVVRNHHLVRGVQISCGCQGVQRRSQARHGVPSEGQTKHYLYDTHRQMMLRCYKPEHIALGRYGARGISVHSDWLDAATFCAAIDSLLGPRPEGHTLDRIDSDGNYEPENVRWADGHTQRVNRSLGR